MVITVTLNPAIDKTLIVDGFQLGSVNRTMDVRHDIGGKGVNVSKVLKNLGIDSLAIGFLGGVFRKSFESELDKRNITHRFVKIKNDTRTNMKIVDNINKTYTDINEAGPQISTEELNEFIDIYKEVCKEGDIVVLSGGVPRGVSKDIYKVLTGIAKEKGALVIIDAEGELLEEGMKEKPFAIKPNDHELSIMFNEDLKDEKSILEKALLVKNNMKISNILVSMGSRGALYITDKGKYIAGGLKVPVKSTVGAGDSMVAALVYSMVKELDDENTLGFAQACGAATVTLEGTEACSKKQVEELLPKSMELIRRI
ncbi:1-phosphofructokinase [Clostridium intestinale]|jgi:1-phosphofructokinase|uniref:1-phosphofructokinase n=1 Tax=Clostridium intestinale TaxID=36845 RepID=UPI002DD66325|nr:1-phosphofructokinase [Clostridium intestinale]WRY50901.1 1-phosphofructokinase [Clostridium intestinale]